MKTWTAKSGYKLIRVLAGRSNAFLLTDGVKNILIDTGPSYMWKWLKGRLDKLGVRQIDALILTHSHMDHAENVPPRAGSWYKGIMRKGSGNDGVWISIMRGNLTGCFPAMYHGRNMHGYMRQHGCQWIHCQKICYTEYAVTN
jgi:hypothetical protein